MTPYIIKDIYHYCNVSVNKCKQIKKHRISYYDLTFVFKGSMTYLADGQTYVLNENDAILLPPGTVRQRMAGEQKVQYVSFNFQILPNCELLISPFLKNIITQDIRKLINVFSQTHLSPKYHSKEKLCNLLNYILYELLDALSLQSNHSEVIKIEKYIDENITKKSRWKC